MIVGAGQVLCRETDEERTEPAALIAEALREAARDSTIGEPLLRRADSVRCVPVLGWHYRDAAALIAEDLGASPRETVQSGLVGGDGPQRADQRHGGQHRRRGRSTSPCSAAARP